MAQMISKYDLGQTVYGIGTYSTRRRTNCETCSQTGSVSISGDVFICPKCQGMKFHETFVGNKWILNESGTVGQIRAEATSSEWCLRSDELSFVIQYMLNTTGVRSGTLWNEDRLFPNRDEAQAACDRLNKGTNFEDDKLAEETPNGR